jgi:hypothetical protein
VLQHIYATLAASSGFDQLSMIALASSLIREPSARLWNADQPPRISSCRRRHISFQWHQSNCVSNSKDIIVNLLQEVIDAANDSLAEDL